MDRGEVQGVTVDRRLGAVLALVFASFATVALAAGILYGQEQTERFVAARQDDLTAICELKVREVSNWLQSQRRDADLVRRLWAERPPDPASGPFLGDRSRAYLVPWLQSLVAPDRWDRIVLYDAAGVPVLEVPPTQQAYPPPPSDRFRRAMDSGEVVFADVHHHDQESRTGLLVPLRDPPADRPQGLVMLGTDPSRHLFPLVAAWPTVSGTAEGVLARADGDRMLLVGPLRGLPPDLPLFRLPPRPPGSHGAGATGDDGFGGTVTDHRGVSIVFAARPIPETPWFLVTKVDRDEIDAPLRRSLGTTALVLGLVLLAGALLFGLVWRGARMQRERERLAEARTRGNLARFYAVLGAVNEAIVRVREPGTLLSQACRVLVETGRFRMAWIGFADPDTGKVVPAASAGDDDRYLEGADITVRDEPRGMGPTGTAIRENRSVIVGDVCQAPEMGPWRDRAECRGLQSSIALPLSRAGRPVGALSVYDATPSAFDPESVQLLERLADDLSFALDAIDEMARRERIERELRAGELRLRLLYEESPLAYQSLDAAGIVQDLNPRWLRMLGYERDEVIGRPFADLVAPGDVEAFRERYARFLAEGTVEGMEVACVRKDGRPLALSVDGSVALHPDGRFRQAHCILRDVTEQRRLQAEQRRFEAVARQQQKLEAIGTLASGVAHEINNPVSAILNYGQLLADDPSDPGRVKEFAGSIVQESERVATIVHNLLGFARKDHGRHGPAHLSDIVRRTLSITAAPLRKDRIEVVCEVPEDLPPVPCRSQQIQQVLMNLLTNARDALNDRFPQGAEGKVIRIAATTFERDGIPWQRLTVEDGGSGIPQDIQDRVFDPFFTTKPRDKGTGLGLSISHGIVEEHRGVLWFETQAGRGTRFHVDLPRDEGGAPGGPGGNA